MANETEGVPAKMPDAAHPVGESNASASLSRDDASHTLPVGKNTLMAILAYLGPLVIVSYIAAKDDTFVKFHIKQGLVLFIAEIVLWVLHSTFWYIVPFWMVWNVINLVLLVFIIIGIMNAVQGNEKELPLIGNLGKNFSI